jgi:hypothetical protein
MNSKSRVLTLSLSAAVIATAFVGTNALAGAKGPDGAYGQPASNRVVVGTVRGNQGFRGNRGVRGNHANRGNRGRGARGGNRVVVVQPQLNGPRNYYFEQRTGQGIAGAPAMPSVYFNARTNRGAKRQNRNARVVGNRAASRRGLTEQEVRALIDQLPPRNRNTVIDPRTQAAERESSGISFGPRSTTTAAALATSRRAPSAAAVEGLGQRAPRTESELPRFDTGKHGSNQYIYAQGTWYVPHDGRLRPALPPSGLTVNALPNGFESVSRGGREYFTYDGVYLRRYGDSYVVVDMPAGSAGGGNDANNGDDATPSLN